ncbi:metal ABC transporter solute-binding protein, Zn/Mn family, partial [Muricomes intestini]|uniref:metal ABC transporter solute-binding protein, Zn/Mn family n=1 Tax=Muricomes intestini TaxID=1796634 RepID=UPI003A5BA4FF
MGTAITGCKATVFQNNSDVHNSADRKLKVVSTIFPQYDFVRQIAGDKVDLKMLLKPGEESHSYEPTPQDI